MKRQRHRSMRFLSALSVLLFCGCSRVGLVLMDSAFEAPSFAINASNLGDGRALLSWPLDRPLSSPDLSTSNDSFSVFYAYYLYRSDLTPWRGYRLVNRLYNPQAQWEVTNVEDGKPVAKDLRLLPSDPLNWPLSNLPARATNHTNEVWWIAPAPAGLNYYRVERVQMKRDSTRDSNGVLTTRSHPFRGDGVSSWTEPGHP